MRVRLVLMLLLGGWFDGACQAPTFLYPLRIPIQLTSNFGEIRNDHFHTGYDFRTMGKTGIPVYASADGHVYRIKVSATGFGKALYLRHAGNFMTVYAHLESFNEPIGKYVKKMQYERQSFEVELFPDAHQFVVRAGDLIGYSGNSGTSSGPHLHFEIRDAVGESYPLNPDLFFPLVDQEKPLIQAIYLYPNQDGCVQTKRQTLAVREAQGAYVLQDDSLVVDYRQVGVAVSAKDYSKQAAGSLGVYSLELSVDGEVLFAMKMDRLDFQRGRYVNAHIDYEAWKTSKRIIQKLYVEPGDRNTIYSVVKNRGIIMLSEQHWRHVRVRVADARNNVSTVQFWLRFSGKERPALQQVATTCVRYDQAYSFHTDSLRVEWPAYSLYKNAQISIAVRPQHHKHIYHIGDSNVPLHQPMTIALLPSAMDARLRPKMIIVRQETSGRQAALPTTWKDGWLTTQSRSFGVFQVAVDTTKPVIVPIDMVQGGLLKQGAISFRVKDNLSGIVFYEGRLNGQWVLTEYDPKNDLMRCIVEPELPAGLHHLQLRVTDAVQNEATYEIRFIKQKP